MRRLLNLNMTKVTNSKYIKKEKRKNHDKTNLWAATNGLCLQVQTNQLQNEITFPFPAKSAKVHMQSLSSLTEKMCDNVEE